MMVMCVFVCPSLHSQGKLIYSCLFSSPNNIHETDYRLHHSSSYRNIFDWQCLCRFCVCVCVMMHTTQQTCMNTFNQKGSNICARHHINGIRNLFLCCLCLCLPILFLHASMKKRLKYTTTDICECVLKKNIWSASEAAMWCGGEGYVYRKQKNTFTAHA